MSEQEKELNWLVVGGRIFFFILVCIYTLKFLFITPESNVVGRSFLHLVNLPFHEAGHILFRPFGSFFRVLGGSLMQILIPLVCVFAFIFSTRDLFGAAVASWWTGESLMDLAPYISDARALKLILLGGVTGRDVEDYHDWEYLLRETGLLRHDITIGWIAHIVGLLIMLSALLWAMFVLYQQIKLLRAADYPQ
jgi:hypothetical protein